MAREDALASPRWAPVLGLAGILGGLLILAPFVVEFPGPPVNQGRLILFALGGVAVVMGTHALQVPVAPALARLAVYPAAVSNAWYAAMVILAIGRDSPFIGDFGFVWYLAGQAMWLANAWFGLVTWHLRVVNRWGAAALIGSILVLLAQEGWLHGPLGEQFQRLGLVGIALNGIGWILLGIDLVRRRRVGSALTA
jgi:hypothetical protein